VCLFGIAASAQTTTFGRGTILDHLPSGQLGPVDNAGAKVLPRVVAGTKGPFPTNDWWSSLLFPRDPAFPFGKALFAWPLTFKARADGWSVGVPDPTPSLGSEFHYGQIDALVASVDGLTASQVKVVGWTDWTVKARVEDGIRQLDATMGHGLPYAHYASKGGDALITCMTTPVVWAGSGTDAVGITVAGNHYGLFAPPGSSWTLSGKVFRSSLDGKGHWSIAVLPDNSASTLDRFRRSAFAYPADTRLAWSVDLPTGTVRSSYRVRATALEGTDTTTIVALFRHQWTRTKDVNTSWSYVSPRGPMKVVDGNVFTTEDALPAILPALPPPANSDVAALRREVLAASKGSLLTTDADTYWAGKGFWRAGSLVDLADQLGETALRDSLLTAMKADLEAWFTAKNGTAEKTKKMFALEPNWGSLIGYPTSYGSDAELNDHHFHYGYFIQAAATIARFDKNWASKENFGPMVELLIRDANNPRHDDAMFPFLRHFDIYDGHSWAAGHAYFDAGNNNESSSEGMNFSAAVAMWGMATGNDSLRDAGLWMAATEMRAVEQYWWDVDDAVFPKGFQTKAVGMVWGNGGAHATWFSGEPEAIHGINVLPFTPASLQWTRYPARVGQELSEMRAEKTGGSFTQWKDILFAYQAITDASGAWTAFDSWDGQGAEGGATKPWFRRWMALMRDNGTLDTAVAADRPACLALGKGAVRTYIGWNPGEAPISVKYSDGHILTIGAGKVAIDTANTTGTVRSTASAKTLRSARMVGLGSLSRLGSVPVAVRSLDGTLRFRGSAAEASRIPGDRIWIVDGL